MSIYLAIDGGGTSTRCLLADEERVLARATTGSVKLMRVTEAEATARLHGMLDEVSAAARVNLSEVTRTCFGLAGLTIPEVRDWAQKAVAARVSGELILCGDEEIALDAAFQGGPGILVIAGTGSNVIGRTAERELVGAGGWGPVLGDEGAGYWIGLEGIRAALRARDRAAADGAEARYSAQLLEEVERQWGLGSLPELIALGNHRGDGVRAAPDFAALAPVVARCAEQGNAIAGVVLRRAGEDLGELVGVVARKVGAGAVDVAFTGSVLGQVAAVREAMVTMLARTLPAARVLGGPVDSLEGALYRARQSGADKPKK